MKEISTPESTQRRPRVAAFFAGAGGLDLGFDQAGFDVVYATDFDPHCVETLRVNAGRGLKSKPDVVLADIRKLSKSDLPTNIDFVIGGPPCQSFSASGRRAGGAAGTLDLRGTLFEAYCRVLTWLNPKGFLFENVRGILATNGGRDWEKIREAFNQLGYETSYRVLDALDYGAPQQRERLFLVGHRKDRSYLFPEPTFGPDSISKAPHITSEESFLGLKNTEDLESLMLRDGKYAHLLPLVPPGSNYLHFTAKRGYANPIFAYRSRFSDFLYKADPKSPVKTVIASPGKYTGPFHWDNRYFTVAEYKRLQGFPDNYVVTGKRSDAIKQIGNAVNPKIARILAESIAVQLFDRTSEIRLLPSTTSLTFDKRKGAKAQRTRALHAEVRDTVAPTPALTKRVSYEARIEPSSLGDQKPNVKVSTTNSGAKIVVRADASRRIFAKMSLRIDGIPKATRSNGKHVATVLDVCVYGESDHAIQTMWNAVDDWVIRSSSFHSLFELYGHFTEPHPVFEIVSFKAVSDHPIAVFADHCANFDNCSKLLPRSHLSKLFGQRFKKSNFLDLVEILRRHRFDIRCKDINIAMPEDKYMVAYPFTLPVRKQMNFAVRRGELPGGIRVIQSLSRVKKKQNELKSTVAA